MALITTTVATVMMIELAMLTLTLNPKPYSVLKGLSLKPPPGFRYSCRAWVLLGSRPKLELHYMGKRYTY